MCVYVLSGRLGDLDPLDVLGYATGLMTDSDDAQVMSEVISFHKQASRKGKRKEIFPGFCDVWGRHRSTVYLLLRLTAGLVIWVELTSVGSYFATISQQTWPFLEWISVFSILVRSPHTPSYMAPRECFPGPTVALIVPVTKITQQPRTSAA